MATYYSLAELQIKFPMVANELIRRTDIKPADVAPVVHAHWIGETDDLFPADSMVICSNCGEYEYLSVGGNYCGNCGAKMDEEIDTQETHKD